MKKLSIKLILICLVSILAAGLVISPDALAKGKKKGLTQDEITQMNGTITNLKKKVYAQALFSPKDNENLIGIKLRLDEALEAGAKPELASLFYKTGYLCEQRELRDEAIDSFQTILDNFPDSPFALKSINELKKMGVKIQAPSAAIPGTTP